MDTTLHEYFKAIGSKGGKANTPAQARERAKPKGGGRPKGAKDSQPRKRLAKRGDKGKDTPNVQG